MKRQIKFTISNLLIAAAMTLAQITPVFTLHAEPVEMSEAEPIVEQSSSEGESFEESASDMAEEDSEPDGELSEMSMDSEDAALNAENPIQDEQLSFEAQDGSIAVKATAPYGVVPEDAQLVLKVLSEDGETAEQYQKALETLQQNEVDYSDLLAVDLHFEKDGQEIEPDKNYGEVSVEFSINDSTLLEDKKDLKAEIHHHIENNGEVSLETVASVSSESTETVLDASFAVDSFSVFTIVWKEEKSDLKIRVHYVTETGESIGDNYNDLNWIGESYQEVIIKDSELLNKTIGGYEYKKAKIDGITKDSPEVDKLIFLREQTYHKTVDEIKFTFGKKVVRTINSKGPTDITVDLFLIYSNDSDVEQPVKILDTLSENGKLTAEISDLYQEKIASGEYQIQWQRRDSNNGNWNPVERNKKTGDTYNISEDGYSIYPAVDDGAQTYYRFEIVNVETKEIIEESPEAWINYYFSIQNGGFEKPVVQKKDEYWDNNSAITVQVPNGTSELYWKTTGVGSGGTAGQDIEIIRPENNQTSFESSYGRITYNGQRKNAFEEKQIAEINCEAYGALYQDVLTVPGSTLTWQFAHAGRSVNNGSTANKDLASVVIVPTWVIEKLIADNQSLNTYTEFSNNLFNNANYSRYVTEVKVEATKGSWTVHSGTYKVPENQHLTRFFFLT